MYNSGNSSKNVTGASVVDGTLDNADYADNAISGNKIDGGTISNFQSTGIDDNAPSNAIVIDSSKRVIIGNPTTIAPAQANNLTIGNTGGSRGLTIMSSRTGTGNIYFHDNDNNDSAAIIYAHSTDAMTFKTNRGDRASIDSIGNFRLNAGGIQFNGDTAAANALDDYEEGTWSPHIKDSNDGSTIVTATNQGRYTKVGNMLYLEIGIYVNSITHTFVGYPYIDLPFSVGSYSEGAMFIPSYYSGTGTTKCGYVSGSTEQIRLATQVDKAYSNTATGTVFSGNIRLYGNLTARTG
jgi:hypothetical protein